MIKLENIEKHFINKHSGEINKVLQGINLHISSGEYVAIQGKSGSGKSTLLNIIGLLDVQASGNYYFNGHLFDKTDDLSLFRQKYFGYIFQSYHLINTLTVRENIELPLIYLNQKIDRNKTQELCEHFGIEKLLDGSAQNLSGGEKQRVAICRAIINDPKIVICDEPTGNLDDENTQAVLSAFDELKQQGKTLLLVTHNKEVAKRADTQYYLEEGVLKPL